MGVLVRTLHQISNPYTPAEAIKGQIILMIKDLIRKHNKTGIVSMCTNRDDLKWHSLKRDLVLAPL